MKKRILLLLIMTVGVYSAIFNITLAETYDKTPERDKIYSGGGLSINAEDLERFKDVAPHIIDVKLNTQARNMLTHYTQESTNLTTIMNTVELGDEIITDKDVIWSISTLSNYASNSELPSSVDVSTKDSFPPIRDQGSTNTCLGWSLAYYQLTNNIANIRNYNAKTGMNAEMYRMSPVWVYNLINGGDNNPTYFDEGLEAIRSFGCVSCQDCAPPVVEEDGSIDYDELRTWHPTSLLWEKALKNQAEGVWLELSDSDCMNNIKKILMNGYVVSFLGTIYNGSENWEMELVNNELVCYCVKEVEDEDGIQLSGGHFMTIVGYDDDLWLDINNNGEEDDGEKGAFKVANSWGSDFANDGYYWLLYDSLNEQSAIPDYDMPQNRIPAVQNGLFLLLKPSKSYEPLLIAEVTINTAHRNQIGVELGISDNTQFTPSFLRNVVKDNYFHIAFNFPALHEIEYLQTGNNFEGEDKANDGTFIFDLTPIVNQYEKNQSITGINKPYRFYVKLKDIGSDNTLSKLVDFKVIDRKHNTISNHSTVLPLTANNGDNALAYADFTLNTQMVSNNKSLMVDFNNPIMESTVNGDNIYMTNDAGDRIDIQLTQNDTGESITISPLKDYQSGNFYNLIIGEGLLSSGGNKLTTPTTKELYVR